MSQFPNNSRCRKPCKDIFSALSLAGAAAPSMRLERGAEHGPPNGTSGGEGGPRWAALSAGWILRSMNVALVV